MTRTSVFLLDDYNENVIQKIVEKYDVSYEYAAESFFTSEVHRMLENPKCAMWEFSYNAIFDMWEVEKITGDPRNSVYLRSEEYA